MRITWAIPCRGVDIPPDGAANLLGAGTNLFQPPELPAQINVVVALWIAAREDELDEPQQLEAIVLDPQMEQTGGQLSLPLTVESSPNRPPGWEQTTVLPLGIMFDAAIEGTYTVQFSIEGRDMSPVALFVAPR